MGVTRTHVLGCLLGVTIPAVIYVSLTYMDLNIVPQGSLPYCEPCPKVTQETETGTRPPDELDMRITRWQQAAAMIFWYNMAPEDYKCKNILPAGNWPVCQEEAYAVKKPCLVYSFGIAYDFTFDDAMGQMGCEVHSFDPSMNVSNHNRSQQVTFHAIGLSSVDSNKFVARQDMYVKGRQVWKIRTLKTIMKELGHENRVLDILKIDVEGHEWTVVKNILDDGLFANIRQFYLEWHLFSTWPSKDTYLDLYKLYMRLEKAKLVTFWKRRHEFNLSENKFNIQGDFNYINTNFTHPSHR